MLSKSQYMKFIDCPKRFWLYKNKYNQQTAQGAFQEHLFSEGKEIEKEARKFFPKAILNEYGWEDSLKAVERTRELMQQGAKYIFQAAFTYNDFVVFVDVLEKADDGYNIVEIKAGTEIKEEYLQDIAIQNYILKNCRVNVKHCFLMYVNNKYVKVSDDINLQEFFIKEEVSSNIAENTDEETIKNTISAMKAFANQPEPVLENANFRKSACGGCEFHDYCWKVLPRPSIYDLPRIGTKAEMLREQGIIAAKDIPNGSLTSQNLINWVEVYKSGKPYVNASAISSMIGELRYPLYYLDFETINFAIPKFIGTKPYEQIPFQFSLHIQATPNGELIHEEYLFEGKEDPRYECAKKLKEFIGPEGSIAAHHASFEKTCIKGLAALNTPESSFLSSLEGRLYDTEDIYKNYYLHPKFLGSSSIKYILPVVATGMTYKEMSIGNGVEAMVAFDKLYNGGMSSEEEKKVRKDLLKYCEQDTMAMVKLVEFMYKIVSEFLFDK